MRAWGRRAVVLAALVASVYGIGWVLRGSQLATDSAIDRAQILGAIASVAAFAVAVLVLWPRVGRLRTGPGEHARLAAAQTYLTRETFSYWRRQAEDRGITIPGPARVTWAWADPDVAPPADDLRAAAPRLLTSGAVTDLAALYRELPARHPRLVVLGGPGAGKTGAMILLLLDLLQPNAPATARLRPAFAPTPTEPDPVTADLGEPVPVWLTLGSWNPYQTRLRDLVAASLREAFPALEDPEWGGPGSAAELLRTRRVALFLDGLDEMPKELRGVALAVIDREAGDLPVVLTSRGEEYAAALREGHLNGAATVKVLPLDPHRVQDQESIQEFLLAGQIRPEREAWREVVDHLRSDPEGVLARTLTTPLALSLARDTYTPGHKTTPRHKTPASDPRDLLRLTPASTPAPDISPSETIGSCSDTEVVLRRLMGAFLHHAYPPDHAERENALRWLAWIAHRLDGNRNLTWWAIPTWLPERRLIKLVRRQLWLAFWLVYVVGLLLKQMGGLNVELARAFVGGLGGLAFGLMGGLRENPGEGLGSVFRREVSKGLMSGPRALVQRRPTRQELVQLGLRSFLFGLMVAALSELALTGRRPPSYHYTTYPALIVGPVSWLLGALLGLSFGLLFGIDRWWSTPAADSPAATPDSIYRANRSYGLASGLALALQAGLVFGLGAGLVFGVGAGLGTGLGVALGAGLEAVRTNTAAAWVTSAQLLLRLQGRGRVQFMGLLQDAVDRQVLRQAGPVYQFRHAALQDYLATQVHSEDDRRLRGSTLG